MKNFNDDPIESEKLDEIETQKVQSGQRDTFWLKTIITRLRMTYNKAIETNLRKTFSEKIWLSKLTTFC